MAMGLLTTRGLLLTMRMLILLMTIRMLIMTIIEHYRDAHLDFEYGQVL